ncbi:M56 family metallopeptidase [Flavobacterium sp. UBA7682]|uniref:M56 family metallopeptidase n=1 Tax=Flavobacterium sp. UBA7682 TaxID=1946560 RepID=UPI0025C32BFD|nr:M56 family metallopeptidase [Flavobacterium sp. UBA7682]
METLLIYLLKSSGLIAVFYLAYYFLVRKETFFSSNRWFLIAGLFTSLLLPMLSFTKIIYVERTPLPLEELAAIADVSAPVIVTPINGQSEPLDYFKIVAIAYLLIGLVLLAKAIIDLISLSKLLRNQKVVKSENYSLIDLRVDIAPFSFFNYIVYNSNLYTQNELENILQHEKIHSQQKHSFDLLIAKLFCIVFWFNPFIWLYKKSIVQNLEYIADNEATLHLDDKTSYQKALLKVTASKNCFSLTNHFYQSLIKKRIIMLNQNQSHKRNLWKYAVVIPSLIAFVFLFQINTEARNKVSKTPNFNNTANTPIAVINENVGDPIEGAYVFDKISSDKEFKENALEIKSKFNIDLKVSNIKRNGKGEIIAIKLSYDDNKGNKGKTEQIRDIPIRPIFFKISKKDEKNVIGFYDNSEFVVKPTDPVNESKITTIESIKDDALIYVDGQRYTKEDLNELDPKGLEKIEILKDIKSLEKYNAKDKKEVIVITTNWTTRQETPEPNASSIFTLENGDEVVLFDRVNIKVPGHPAVQFTDNSPVLIFNGVPQKNPRLLLESMDISKIKSIKVFNENDSEVKGTPIYKMIITTK